MLSFFRPFCQKHENFPDICNATGGNADATLNLGLCFVKNSIFLYSLLKLAANAVLKLISALMSTEHVLSVIINRISFSTLLLEYSLVEIKSYSTTLCLCPFLPVNYVFLLKVYLLVIGFSVSVSPTPTTRTKLSVEFIGDCVSDISLSLMANTNNGYSGSPKRETCLISNVFILLRSAS